jgi:ABC-type branched-subunit amino acid transport system ATPase component
MDSGELIFSGTPKQAREEPRVIEAYLGRENHAA